MPGDSAIEVTSLRKTYRDRAVLDGVSLSVTPGTIFGLLGPNGAGKTTMVSILTTLVRPDGGTATVGGFDVVRDAPAVRTILSVTGQSSAVDDFLTGRENLLMMARLHNLSGAAARARASDLLAQFDLQDAAHQRVVEYSGGMIRRLDLAMSLIRTPRVLFLDEPTTGLDPRSRLAVWDAVRNLATQGVTVFLTTQYLEEADQLADSIAVLDQGRVVASGTGPELKRSVPTGRVEFGFPDPTAFAGAMELLTDGVRLGGDPPDAPQAQPDDERLTVSFVSADSAALITAVVGLLAGSGYAAERISIVKPSLDEAFLALTDNTRKATP